MTVLQLTQSILSSLDSDEVNSISDTVESLQVARIIQNKYYDILARGDLPEQEQLLKLTPSTDDTKPVLMYVPDGVSRIDWIKYFDSSIADSQQEDQFGSYSHDLNTDLNSTPSNLDSSAAGYKYVTILPIRQFLDYINKFNPSDSDVGTFTFTENNKDFTFYYKNDHQPNYCTVIETQFVIFDSYNNTLENTLQESKVMAYGQSVTPFQLIDSFVPDLDDNQFPLLLNEAKSLAFYELKQMPHMKADQEVKRQWNVVQKNKAITNKPGYFDQLADFGRVPRTGGYGGVYPAYRWMRGPSV